MENEKRRKIENDRKGGGSGTMVGVWRRDGKRGIGGGVS